MFMFFLVFFTLTPLEISEWNSAQLCHMFNRRARFEKRCPQFGLP